MSDLDLVAFGDESCKPVRDRATGKPLQDQIYVAAAMVAFSGDLTQLRSDLETLANKIGQPLHYRRLARTQRLAVLEALAAIEGWDGYVYETADPFGRGTSEHHVRSKLLQRAFPHLASVAGVSEVVLETRNVAHAGAVGLDQKDHQVLQRLHARGAIPPAMRLRHDGKNEPARPSCGRLPCGRS